MRKGDIYWADLGEPIGSEPGFRRPVLVIQNDMINKSKLATIIVLALTSNLNTKDLYGCVLLTQQETGLPKDSVANSTQLRTIDKERLTEFIGTLRDEKIFLIDNALRSVLDL